MRTSPRLQVDRRLGEERSRPRAAGSIATSAATQLTLKGRAGGRPAGDRLQRRTDYRRLEGTPTAVPGRADSASPAAAQVARIGAPARASSRQRERGTRRRASSAPMFRNGRRATLLSRQRFTVSPDALLVADRPARADLDRHQGVADGRDTVSVTSRRRSPRTSCGILATSRMNRTTRTAKTAVVKALSRRSGARSTPRPGWRR